MNGTGTFSVEDSWGPPSIVGGGGGDVGIWEDEGEGDWSPLEEDGVGWDEGPGSFGWAIEIEGRLPGCNGGSEIFGVAWYSCRMPRRERRLVPIRLHIRGAALKVASIPQSSYCYERFVNDEVVCLSV